MGWLRPHSWLTWPCYRGLVPLPWYHLPRCKLPKAEACHRHPLYQLALYSIFSPLDLNSMWRICDRHLPNSSRTICSARLGEQRSCSASSPWASRQAHVASTTSQEIQEKVCLRRDTATQRLYHPAWQCPITLVQGSMVSRRDTQTTSPSRPRKHLRRSCTVLSFNILAWIGDGLMRPQTSLRSNWQLMADGGKGHFLQGCSQ